MAGEPPPENVPLRMRRWPRIVAGVLGVGLLTAAIAVVLREGDGLRSAWQAARAAPPWLVCAVALSPLANWVFTSAVFWILTRRFAPVRVGEMAALVGSAWLLNMLPGKPGLIARVAYHRQVSGIPIPVSLLVTLMAVLTGGVGIVIAVAAQLVIDADLRTAAPPDRLWPIAAAVLGLALIPGIVLTAQRGRADVGRALSAAPALALAIGLRVAETHIWAARYWLAFTLVGQEHSYGLCVLVAGVSQVAGQMPVQLGVREWAVGLATGVLSVAHPAGPGGAAGGLTVDLVCRLAEVLCAAPIGLASYAWLLRHLAAVRARGSGSASGGTGGNTQPVRGV